MSRPQFKIQAELKAQYPLIASGDDEGWRLANIVNDYTNYGSKIDGITELEELELFYADLYKSHQKKLKGRINTVRRTANFDISKIQDLPDDIIGVIKSYIKPELDFVKEITVLDNYARLHRQSAPRAMERWLNDVPKELIVDLLRTKYSNSIERFSDISDMKVSDNKSEWCYYIHNTLQTLTEYNDKPVSCLLKNYENYYKSKIYIPAMYGFLLRMKVFIAYRYKLEAHKKANKAKLSNLKKSKII
jgi:hypothetical protein